MEEGEVGRGKGAGHEDTRGQGVGHGGGDGKRRGEGERTQSCPWAERPCALSLAVNSLAYEALWLCGWRFRYHSRRKV
jgi:hypothetical protein